MNENEMNTEVMETEDEMYDVVETSGSETTKAVVAGAATAVVVTALIAGIAKGGKWVKGKWDQHVAKKAANQAVATAETLNEVKAEGDEEFVEDFE